MYNLSRVLSIIALVIKKNLVCLSFFKPIVKSILLYAKFENERNTKRSDFVKKNNNNFLSRKKLFFLMLLY